jgi:hypothetical protein
VNTLAALRRRKGDLIAENALLRQQLLVLWRSVQRVPCTPRLLHYTTRTKGSLSSSRCRASQRRPPHEPTGHVAAVPVLGRLHHA